MPSSAASSETRCSRLLASTASPRRDLAAALPGQPRLLHLQHKKAARASDPGLPEPPKLPKPRFEPLGTELAELGPAECRFPIAETETKRGQIYLFCGEPTGDRAEVYCERHKAVCLRRDG